MARQAPGRNQDGVKTQLKFGVLGMRHQPGLRGVDDARLLPGRHGEGGLVEAGTGLDLDKGYEIAPLRDDVDFAMGRPEAFGEDTIAFGHEVNGGAALGREAGAERRDTLGRSGLDGPTRRSVISLRHGRPSRSLPWQAP